MSGCFLAICTPAITTKVLNTSEKDVLKITSIEQDAEHGSWKIRVSAALNEADAAAGVTVNLNRINGLLKVIATDDLGKSFKAVDASKFSLAPAAQGSPDVVITVTDSNARFLRATVTK